RLLRRRGPCQKTEQQRREQSKRGDVSGGNHVSSESLGIVGAGHAPTAAQNCSDRGDSATGARIVRRHSFRACSVARLTLTPVSNLQAVSRVCRATNIRRTENLHHALRKDRVGWGLGRAALGRPRMRIVVGMNWPAFLSPPTRGRSGSGSQDVGSVVPYRAAETKIAGRQTNPLG